LGEHQYVHSVEKDEVELERLKRQADIYDPVTVRRLEVTGVSEGWNCLEVGAGTGSVVEWLSTRVGLSGRVVATDIDLRFLNRISAPNLEIRRHDILRDDIEEGKYDLVHCRFVLMHLSEPERGLRRMAGAVRPGGWLVVEDHDAGSMLSADVTDPSAVPLVNMVRAMTDYGRNKGIADGYIGRRLRGLVEGLGFVDVGQDGWTCMYHGDEPSPHSGGLGALGSLLIAEGVLTQEGIDSAYRLLRDPAFNYPGMTIFSSWGRKPVEERGT
jgi:SAM-dependent methyltransferase